MALGYLKFKEFFGDHLGWKLRDCYAVQVNDDDEVPDNAGSRSVVSCVGLGEPIYFYLSAVFLLAGVTAASLFALGTTIR